jgi:hypothetical protein
MALWRRYSTNTWSWFAETLQTKVLVPYKQMKKVFSAGCSKKYRNGTLQTHSAALYKHTVIVNKTFTADFKGPKT